MKNALQELIKNTPKYVWILTVIILLGIFFRTYQYSDWLRFNADQSRDASLVSTFVTGGSELPLLGPKAGGTEFKLGAAFYYLQIMSAEIFGNNPAKMAFPDLFAGILTIPLIFLLTKRYFKTNIALVLAFIASVSIFLIKYARFAWNPNSGPFYTLLFLYALLLLADKKSRKPILWAILAGIALGIGVQLHTMLLIIMPIVAVIFFIYLWKKGRKILRYTVVIFAVAIFLNIPQIVSEYKTGGSNTKAFLGGTSIKTAKDVSISENLIQNSLCQVQSNVFIVSGLGSNDSCGTSLVSSAYKKATGSMNKIQWAVGLLMGILFSVGGIWFWIRNIKKENEENKKLMLMLTGIFALVGFLFLIPLANEISLRFYLAIIFVPFMLLGFWIERLFEWKRNKFMIGFISIVIMMISATNVWAIKSSFADYSGGRQISGSTKSEITLGEVEFIANYIMQYAKPNSTVLVEGKQKYLFKYLKSVEYFTRSKNIKVKALSKKSNPSADTVIVYIENSKNKGKLTTKLAETYTSRDVAFYGRFFILQLIKK